MADEKNEKIITDRESMLSEIKEKIVDKTLSFWCQLDVNLRWDNDWWPRKFGTVIVDEEHKNGGIVLYRTRHPLYQITSDRVEYKKNIWELKIIWHKVILSRVLSALGEFYDYRRGYISFVEYIIDVDWKRENWEDNICERKLLNEDLSDAMLDDQSDETIEKLHEILVRKITFKG